jgi:hypothetical protein
MRWDYGAAPYGAVPLASTGAAAPELACTVPIFYVRWVPTGIRVSPKWGNS